MIAIEYSRSIPVISTYILRAKIRKIYEKFEVDNFKTERLVRVKSDEREIL